MSSIKFIKIVFLRINLQSHSTKNLIISGDPSHETDSKILQDDRNTLFHRTYILN
jgi:hypothetical protein